MDAKLPPALTEAIGILEKIADLTREMRVAQGNFDFEKVRKLAERNQVVLQTALEAQASGISLSR